VLFGGVLAFLLFTLELPLFGVKLGGFNCYLGAQIYLSLSELFGILVVVFGAQRVLSFVIFDPVLYFGMFYV